MTDERTEEELDQERQDADQFVRDVSCEAFENMYTRLGWQDQMTLQMVLGEAGEEELVVPLEDLRDATKRLERPDDTDRNLSWFQRRNGVFDAYLEADGKMSWVGEMAPDEERGMVWRPGDDLSVHLEGHVYTSFRERLYRVPIRTGRRLSPATE